MGRTPTATGNDDFDKRSSASSKSSGGRILARLRRAIADAKKSTPQSAPALRWLWWIIVALVLTNAVLATVQAYLASTVFTGFHDDRECKWG